MANANASAPFVEQDGGELPLKPFGCARRPHQAAAALRELSRALLATMDAIAELFEHTRRGEDCSEEDGACMEAMVENSRAMLWGIAASFMAADLQATMAQATATARQSPEPHFV